MEALQASPDELTAPRIPRFRGLFRTFKASILALILLLIIRLAWGYFTTRQIETRQAEIRARGELTRTSDFNPPAIPDEQNAAYHIVRAANMMKSPDPENASVYFLQPRDPCTPANEQIARAWIKANQASLQTVEIALKCDLAVWKTDRTKPQEMSEGYNAARRVTMLLVTASTIALKDGDSTLCLARTEQAFRIYRALRWQPWWMAQSGRSSFNRGLADQIGQVLPSLSIEDGAHAATRAQIRRLIALFLDDGPDRAAIAQCFQAERAFIPEWTAAAGTGAAWKYNYIESAPPNSLQRIGLWWIAPVFNAHAAGELDYYTALIQAAQQPNAAAMTSKLPPPLQRASEKVIGIYPIDRVALFLGNSDFNRWLPSVYKEYFDRRQAAVFLAARLYESDHRTAPTALAELVPNYLDKIPDDPITGGQGAWKLSSTPPTTSPASRPSQK